MMITAGILDNCGCHCDILRPRDESETAEVTPSGHGDGVPTRDTGDGPGDVTQPGHWHQGHGSA